MHSRIAGTLLIAMFGSLQPTAAQSGPSEPFRPLEFLVGHCWVGTFPNGKATDEHCFEWMFDKKFIRDRHVVRGGEPYQGESVYRWNSQTNRLEFTYWNSAGEVTAGSVQETAEGIVFPQEHQTAQGSMVLKTIWTRPNPDSYHVWVGRQVGSAWETMWTMDLKRK